MPQMTAPEAYIQSTPVLFTDDGEVTDPSTEEFLRDFMNAFPDFISHVVTIPSAIDQRWTALMLRRPVPV